MARTRPRRRDDLNEGDTFAVQMDDGRFAACRVLHASTDQRSGQRHVLVAALAWRGVQPPALAEPRLRLLQRITVHNSPGEPHLFWVREERLPEALTYLGVLPPSAEEAALGVGVGHSDWEHFLDRIAAQHHHEEEQGLPPADSEAELRRRARDASRRHAPQRRREALENLSRDPFPSHEEIDDVENAEDYRQILRDALTALQALGADGDEVAKLDVLRQCVERFNAFDEFIYTWMREHICDFFDDLVWVAGLEDYGEGLNCPWRDF